MIEELLIMILVTMILALCFGVAFAIVDNLWRGRK